MSEEGGGSDVVNNVSDGVGFWVQTKLLIEKNWKCKLRADKKKLAGEIFFPVFYLLLLSFLVKTQPSVTYPEQKEPDTQINLLVGLGGFKGRNGVTTVSIVPSENETGEICKAMKEIWRQQQGSLFLSDLNFMYYPTLDALERARNKNENGTDLAIVFFDTNLNSFNYTIMADPAQLPSTSQKLTGLDTCRLNHNTELLESPASCPVNGYFYSGFLGLQYLVDQAFLNSMGIIQNALPNVTLQNYPKLAYNGGMSPLMRAIIPLYSVIPMAQLINSLLVLIVTEKEDRIKDGFRMIGVSDGAYFLSWFIVYTTILGILSTLFTLVMHLTNILQNINVFLLFLIFFLFGLSVITFAFALTPFFHKPKTAGVVGTLIMQFFGMLFMIQTFVKTSTDAFMVPLRLISSLAFTTALDEACAYEYHGGIGFSDLVPGGRGERIMYSVIFICFDTVLYGFIALYLDNVIPNEYGARKHPLYCFTWPFWKTRSVVGYTRSSLDGTSPQNSSSDPNVEGVPPSMIKNQAITIRNIRKTYTSLFGSNKVEAVKGISLDIYDGQITAILGKNGAGKSTLFSIITGLVPPTKGKCTVFGMDTSDPNDMDRLRKMTGVCLQTNLLFAPLTTEEHLQLYGKLRGLNGSTLDREVASILEELKLTDKAKVLSDKLSGGQKRKLSVGIALIGGPKIIILDEPSAGVDPVSRRHLWSLLKRKKEGRVILLATHFLDEADFLADRKAIIHNGTLKCYGSSLFLKNRFGVGYHLTIETEGNVSSERCDNVIEKWTPGALNTRKVIGKEIKYCLPNSSVHNFSSLFNELEQFIASNNSDFKSYGVSMTTLEEVFLKISNDAWEEERTTMGSSSLPSTASTITENQECNLIPDLNEIKINIPETLWFLALLRIRRLIRSPQSFFFMIIFPLLLVAGGLALMKTQNLSTADSLSLDDPKSMYSEKNQLRLAFNSNSDLEDYLQTIGFQVNNYSGNYPDLLDSRLSDPGTMAALDTFNSTHINLRINGTFLHSPPLMLHALAKYYAKTAKTEFSASAKPFASNKVAFDSTTLYAVFLIGPSFTFPAIGLVMELVKDREINARNHLRVNGVSFGLYFSSVFIVFGLLSVFVTMAQIGLIYIFSLSAFMNPYALTITTLLLMLFIVPCLLVSTLFSYLFDRLESAQSVFSPISSWMGTIMGVVIIVMDGISATARNNNVLIVHGFFSAFDIFYIPFGIFYWVNKQYILCTLSDTCEQLSFSNYLGPEIMIMGICLIVQIPILIVLIVIVDVVKQGGNPWSAITALLKTRSPSSSTLHILNGDDNEDDGELTETVDTDVLDEKSRVSSILSGRLVSNNSVVLVHNLRKTYKEKRSIKDRCNKIEAKGYQALKGVNFAVEKGEVFGLLGHNGAGKTTTMRIIIAEESADAGVVRLCGTTIDSNVSDAFLKLGYCAQHDPLWENIRLKEHLELYAVIRGIPKQKRDRIINDFLIGLQIEEHADKKASQLSGGTKRKLSYGISMLGIPSCVAMDEPSTGMDPQSKRFLWNTILGTFKESRGAILTTHSMEEAEVLCSKIAILAKGSLICIGSPQHLKSKYGSGYILEIKLKSEDDRHDTPNEDRYTFVKENFPDSKVNELFDDKAVFSLPTTSIQSISKTFSLLEQLKQQYNIEEYSFSQTTLEQIFLYFAKDNGEDDVDDSN